MSDSVRPQRRQPTRLPRPWDSPGKNTGVGCHCLLQCKKVKSESEVAQSCSTPSDPMDCSPPGSSIHGIFQARALEWVPLPSPQAALVVKNSAAIQETWDVGLIPESGRSPGRGHGNPFQYSCLENPMDRGTWQARVSHDWSNYACIYTQEVVKKKN